MARRGHVGIGQFGQTIAQIGQWRYSIRVATQRVRTWTEAGWSVRGDLRISGKWVGESELESLAERFAPEGSGHWKLANESPVSAVGMQLEAGALESPFHTHREAQLVYLVRGELTCEASNGLWIVPPQSALWIPSAVVHKMTARAPLEGYSVFIEPNAKETTKLPQECRGLAVSPLLRELMFSLAIRPAPYEPGSPEARLVGVLLDELANAVVEKHRLPIPSDPRLRKLLDRIIAKPSDNATLPTWAKRMGMSERTLNRLLVSETGLSFSRWRQQLHITLALQALSRGAPVQVVASDLGYESSSSFVNMFKKALGTSPARYMARRLNKV
jgi:AraC-like DNA-binding protein/quercetin dioxygenase-like cupin family protein